MDYSTLLGKVQELDFVEDRDTADAMVKSVLGHIASKMREAQARAFADDLPEPLNYQKLRPRQAYVSPISLDQFVLDLERQFSISVEQAQSLIRTILHFAKTDIQKEHINTWESGLPKEWASIVENA